ncbi:MAG: GNAT family N-acetyltransferase [Gammaproteobacteria bacterium]|nr:GNAT family N-acetyltransferase [Gammaproteobacteria bacterium]
MITKTHQLDQPSLIALQTLLDACRTTDGAVIPIYPHLLEVYRPGPPSLLYYAEEQLIGFLAFFHFYPDAAEIALLTHPAHRKQSIAKNLWEIMCQTAYTIHPPLKHLIVSSPKGKNQAWFNQHGFQFEHTEYDMICTPYVPKHNHQPTHTIRQANSDDIKALHTIDHACFNPNRVNPIERIEKLLTTPNLKIFIMFHKKKLVGQVHLIFEAQQVRLTDLAVLPHMQRQGFGQDLLSYCLKYTHKQQHHKMTLNVAAKNQHALRLYQNIGFQIYNAVDYYKRGFSLDRF